jgi:hypothetical protein
MKRLITIGVMVMGLAFASCSSDDDVPKPTLEPPAGVEAPKEGATPPGDPRQLPPEFIRCMAEQGYEVKSSEDIHSAPPQVLQACFGSIH